MNDDALSRASAFGRRVESLAHAVRPPTCGCQTLRLQLVFSQYLICRQHNAAIILLFANRLDGSARALLRPVIETSLRCEWLLMVPTGRELKKIAEHKDGTWKELAPMAQMLDLLQHEEFRRHALQTDLTHTFLHAQGLASGCSQYIFSGNRGPPSRSGGGCEGDPQSFIMVG